MCELYKCEWYYSHTQCTWDDDAPLPVIKWSIAPTRLGGERELVLKWKEEVIHVKKILRVGCGQEEPGILMRVKLRQEVALNKGPVIAHIKARSKALITSGTFNS